MQFVQCHVAICHDYTKIYPNYFCQCCNATGLPWVCRHAAISHTRWATHGEPSATNSHPITSGPKDDFVVVHNGIITNFAELKTLLQEEGEEFVTGTDTEVIPKLCTLFFNNMVESGSPRLPLSLLVMQVLQKLEGAYAILIVSRHYPGELVCCRKGSPVVFAVKNEDGRQGSRYWQTKDLNGSSFAGKPLECFIASDDKAIIEHAQVCCPLSKVPAICCPWS
jgi:glutamine---fructose-6-phosphate transaminase (isomerizing)